MSTSNYQPVNGNPPIGGAREVADMQWRLNYSGYTLD